MWFILLAQSGRGVMRMKQNCWNVVIAAHSKLRWRRVILKPSLFPASVRGYGYPKGAAADIAISVMKAFETKFETIIACVFSKDDFERYMTRKGSGKWADNIYITSVSFYAWKFAKSWDRLNHRQTIKGNLGEITATATYLYPCKQQLNWTKIMAIKVQDLMRNNVITAQPHETVDKVKSKMSKLSLSNMPVVSTDNLPIGIVSASDLLAAGKEGTPISNIMTEKVYTIPEYEDVSVAARMMRNHKIHHLIVTQEQKVIGIISSFDLMKLVEDHRFVMKNASTPKSKGLGKRSKAES